MQFKFDILFSEPHVTDQTDAHTFTFFNIFVCNTEAQKEQIHNSQLRAKPKATNIHGEAAYFDEINK